MIRPRIGMLWGDFPWDMPPPRIGKLLSIGAVARNVTRALNTVGEVIPYQPPPPGSSSAVIHETLASFLPAIDVLWADLYPPSEPALRIRQELGLSCPALLFAGGVMPKGAEAMLLPWQGLLTPQDQLIFTCEADRAIWHQLVRWNMMGEWVVPLGVDDTIFYPRSLAERRATRRQHHLPQEGPLLLYVGRLNIQKNLHTLLRLFAAVQSKLPDAHLGLVGEEDDIILGEFGVRNTGYVAWLRGLADELGVAQHITFLGPLFGGDLARLYAAADVLINASIYHRENFGLAQAEAQACGLPVVCTAWGGFKDVVRQGETGYFMDAILTKHGIRVDWASGAQHVLAILTNSDLHAKMRLQAAAWASKRFSSAVFAKTLAKVVTSLTKIQADSTDSPAYEPSLFARRYEAHKRACGWYADPSGTSPVKGAKHRRPAWYPRMFQGRDYALYEMLMGPYATYQADTVSPSSIEPTWAPYALAELVLDPIRHRVWNRDPIWPHERDLQPLEWEVLQRIDGRNTVGAITHALGESDQPQEPNAILRILWRLYVEGFILFQNVKSN
jgi:glycosyltransferase involved in cell wall biosynthesis